MIIMAGKFLTVTCRDCGTESIIFDRSVNPISCTVCGATLSRPSGGKADLVGCRVVEANE